MTTLTVSDLISQLSQANPDARVVFKIECEDKNFDARLEFSRVTCLSPATEVVVTMADNTEDVRKQAADLEEEAEEIDRKWINRQQRIEALLSKMEEEKMEPDEIFKSINDL